MEKSKFSITLCSDLDYEGMVVDIKYGNKRIALGHYDRGIDNIELKLLRSKKSGDQDFPLSELIEILNEAYSLLKKSALEDGSR